MSPAAREPGLIALDWGTTALRAWLVDRDGTVLDRLARPLGILAVENGDFAGAFAATAGAWRRGRPDLPAVACGMIGSRQGWREAPYVACPASAAAIARGLAVLDAGDGGRLAIVPGLSCEDDGVPDVMRGEETQILGAVGTDAGGLLVLPGTHSKWAVVEGDRIVRFASFMTGEVFAALSRHTILGRLMEGEAIDAAAFARGATAGARDGAPGSLLHRVFAARTLGLFGREQPAALRGWLSGLLIGAEVAAGLAWAGGGAEPLIVGDRALAALYAQALSAAGVTGRIGPEDAALRGLLQIARAAGVMG